MREFLHSCLIWLSAFGIEPLKTLRALKNLPVTFRQYRELKSQNTAINTKWELRLNSPQFHDRDDSGGIASGHYFHQDRFVAQKIYQRNPDKHVDVGSRVDGFVAHVSVFREIEVFDIRSIPNKVADIVFFQQDIMNPTTDISEYCDSLSCLHALEHFGLGRYGDPIDAQGYLKGFKVLEQMLKPDGMLYLSFPIGNELIEFNGQRIFSLNRAFDLFREKFELEAFSYVDDAGDLHEDVELTEKDISGNLGLNYGCGIFELSKR